MKYKFEFTKTFRCFLHGDPENAEILLYVLHGYGQLAEFFINKFKHLNQTVAIVAPEGMHRFYIKGSSGRVGASWMTKEEREDDIRDNINWLNQLDKTISREKSFQKKIILGFSQGGATAARWYRDNHESFDSLIMWASVFPPDLETQSELISNKNNNYFVIGNEDEYFPESERNDKIQYYCSMNFHIIPFEGKHDICSTTIAHLIHSIAK